MAKVSLRVYNRDIEALIEAGQIDEAVAHCMHILKSFPMHVDTYRLLGKAFLEDRRYTDASDIFQRVLMTAPDDFVAHVGMSIIHDDAGKLDDSIWHMERAFEVQPSNPAIQGELRRLYQKRDGAEPPKIRLSRDALANMYIQGELFSQAIAEIRAVLAEDSNRLDLQVMLARAYFRGGRKVDAVETATQLLKNYPNCMDALRILLDVLPATSLADNTQVYRRRLQLLDPYSSFTTGSTFQSDLVSDAAVTLERLEYKAGAEPVRAQPEWAASLGIKLEEETKGGEAQPEWLTPPAPVEQPPVTHEAKPAPQGGDFPDFLRAAGWHEATGEAKEGPLEGITPPEGAEPIAQADLPEWLKSMAPPEITTEGPLEPAPPATVGEVGEVPEWLKEFATPEASKAEVPEVPPAEPEISSILETGLPSETLQETVSEPVAPVEEPAGIEAGKVPDWLKDLKPVEVQPSEGIEAAAEEGGVSEWLETTFPAEAPAEEPGGPVKPVEEPTGVEGLGDIPDWLKEFTHEAEESVRTPESVPAESEVSDWLKGVAPVGAGAVLAKGLEEILPEEGAPAEEEPVVQEPPQEQPPLPVESLPPAVTAPMEPVTAGQPLSIEDDTLAWLESLAAKHGAKPEELLTRPEDRPTEKPESVRKLEIDTQPKPELAGVETLPETTPLAPKVAPAEAPIIPPGPVAQISAPEEIIPTETGAPPIEPMTEAAIPGDILSAETIAAVVEPAAEVTVPEETVLVETTIPAVEPIAEVTLPEEITPAETIPVPEEAGIADFLKELERSEAAGEEPPVLPGEEAVQAPSLPEWLRDLERPSLAAEPVLPGAPGDDIPEWLRGSAVAASQVLASAPGEEEKAPAEEEEWLPLEKEETVGPSLAAPEPTKPEEWVPAEKVEEIVEHVFPVEPSVMPPEAVAEELEISPGKIEEALAPALAAVESSLPEAVPGKGPGMLARIPIQDKDADILTLAQNSLEDGKLEASMQIYGRLIKRGHLLDEVIHDLREATYRFPVDVLIWQALGDAYMRANRLQDALDAYTKAEELLR